MVRARLRQPAPGAQWTGITTRIAERLLETGAVEAVLTMAPDPADSWKPMPVIITAAEGMSRARGMRMGYAPLLALLEPVRDRGYKRIAVIGIPCQVYALRAIEEDLGLDRLYVIGTPCSDNTTTENFHTFLDLLADDPKTITYLEFRADYYVELRFTDGSKKEIPFLKLPISKLPSDFFPLTCRTCVDYTNVLADITVGYMGGEGEQWLLIAQRTRRRIARSAWAKKSASPNPAAPASARARWPASSPTPNAQPAVCRCGRMPDWLRPIVGWLMPRIGPRGLEFARSRLEMKACETVVHLRRAMPRRVRHMVPPHVWALVEPYGLKPTRRRIAPAGC